jgi:CheY-like chemotaxis protein
MRNPLPTDKLVSIPSLAIEVSLMSAFPVLQSTIIPFGGAIGAALFGAGDISGNLGTVVGGGLVGTIVWGVLELGKRYFDAQNLRKEYEGQQQRLQEKHDRDVQDLQRQITEGQKERTRIDEESRQQHDQDLIMIQTARLELATVRMDLEATTGRRSPIPPIFTEEARKALGQSGISLGNISIPEGRDIVVIDDSSDTVTQLKKFLRMSGFIVRSGPSVEKGLFLFQERRPNIILIDLFLPGTPGVELVRKIRAEPENIDVRIIIITGYPESEIAKESLKIGADAILPKPFDVSRLLDLITPADEVLDPSDPGT